MEARIAQLKIKDDCRVSLVEEEIDIAELRNAQQTDQMISSWIHSISNNWKDVEVKDRPQAHDIMLVDDDGLLRGLYNRGRRTKKDPFGVTVKYRVVVPASQKENALSLCHSTPLAGHMGIRRTWKRAVNKLRRHELA